MVRWSQKDPCKVRSEMSGRDLLTDERRLFEELCTTERLEAGFRRVKKNKGSPGIDGVTIAEFESRLDEELSRLRAELDSWTYKPSPVRRGQRSPSPVATASVYSGCRRCGTGWCKPR